MSGVIEKVSELAFGRVDQPELPETKLPNPAADAPERRADTGATVVVGADASKDKRVSGKKSGTGSSSKGGDVLGNLGGGGLGI